MSNELQLLTVGAAAAGARLDAFVAGQLHDISRTRIQRAIEDGDVLVNLGATANATAVCTNPAGANQPPGQNPAPVSVAGSQAIPASEVKNGNVAFSVTTKPPTNPIPGAPGCPNKNWTETITDLSFTGATLTVQQGSPPTTELTVSCSFAPPTSNGTVSKSQVTCRSK